MAYYNEMKVMDGWLMEADGWDIWLGDSYVRTVVDCILENKPIESQMVGYIVGQRRRHYVQVLCQVCDKPVHDLETIEIKDSTEQMRLARVHKECYNKVKDTPTSVSEEKGGK